MGTSVVYVLVGMDESPLHTLWRHAVYHYIIWSVFIGWTAVAVTNLLVFTDFDTSIHYSDVT